MKQRTAILVALGLTVFVLVVAGAIFTSLQTNEVTPSEVEKVSPVDTQNLGVHLVLGPTFVPTCPPTPSLLPTATDDSRSPDPGPNDVPSESMENPAEPPDQHHDDDSGDDDEDGHGDEDDHGDENHD